MREEIVDGSLFSTSMNKTIYVVLHRPSDPGFCQTVSREKTDELHAEVLENNPNIQKKNKQYLGKYQKILS